MAKSLISIQHVTQSYESGGDASVTVLSDLNLEILEGQIVALLGPSGSGKSTFLRIIAGLIQPSEGNVIYKGSAILGVNPGVAMVFQSFALFPWLTVLENVAIGLKAQGVPKLEREKKSRDVIDLIGLDGYENAYPKELSGGMRQRVGFARALVVDPDVLLMDEPFSALDVLTAENLRRDLLEIWLENRIATKGIIIVTHSIEEAVYLADKAVVLSRDPARIIAQVPILLPHWRQKEDKRFLQYEDQLYSLLTRRDPAPREQTRGLIQIPPANSGQLTGLLEVLEEEEAKVDIYKLGDDLSLDVEDLLPIVDAAEMIGFAHLKDGDIALTGAGRAFAAANVRERKMLFRTQVLAQVPALAQIYSLLTTRNGQTVPREFFIDILERSWRTDMAERQLDTLIDWGRYAELFDYDQESRQLYIDRDEETEE